MDVKEFSADTFAWIALGVLDRLDSRGDELTATNLVSRWAETGLRQADLVQGVVALVRRGHLAIRDGGGGSQFHLTEAGRAYIAERRAAESLNAAGLFKAVRQQLDQQRREGGASPAGGGERREGFH